jgi:site-specific DNA-methyltransferase (adenine-specific)
MSESFARINFQNGGELSGLPAGSRQVVAVSTGCVPAANRNGGQLHRQQLTQGSLRLLAESARVLRAGGLLFLYGPPRELAMWGEALLAPRAVAGPMIFKYWIALDLDDQPAAGFLKPTHRGLMLFLKGDPDKKTPPALRLNVDAARTPHLACAACGRTLKDWGGKRHLMNPRGASPADVWRDLPRRNLGDGVIPDDVLQRIGRLADAGPGQSVHVVQPAPAVGAGDGRDALRLVVDEPAADKGLRKLKSLKMNYVHVGDSVAFLRRVKQLHPHGIFDLAFADPPYNLEKRYGNWDDAMAEQHYLDWCNAWLDGMAETLKPGGSLLVLNLPKWAVHHAAFLNRRLDFRHWIVWDALSDPRGKLMPAHYALLYYTKPGGEPVCNVSVPGEPAQDGFVLPPDAPKYCLRPHCVKARKLAGNDAKVALSDVWFDIHRIKHKRDRDAHPCQLPEKLMERIIRLTTRPGDVVFDPFCGAGTTAIAAVKLGRQFVVADVDADYARITAEKLAAMKASAAESGNLTVPRNLVARPRRAGSKRGIELYLQKLAGRLGRMPTETDVQADNPDVLRQIDATYINRGAAFKRSKVALAQAL